MPSGPCSRIFSILNRCLKEIAKTLAIAVFLAVVCSPMAHAQSITFGIGHTKFVSGDASNHPIFSLEYQHAPFKSIGNWNFGAGGALSVDSNGDGHVGIGFFATFDFRNPWFIEASVMPGAYFNGSEANWLGGHFQIRNLVALGYALDDHHSLSLAFMHLSNADTTEFNPGMNSLLLRWRRSF